MIQTMSVKEKHLLVNAIELAGLNVKVYSV